LLYALEVSEVADRERVMTLLGRGATGERDYDDVIEMVRRDGSLDRVYSEAGDYSRRAAEYLGMFPSCPSRDSLFELNDYIVERNW
jgi:geranylgeranyl pyrophosphate synthase